MMTILQKAKQFIDSGIGVLPIGYQDKRPDFNLISSWEPLKTNIPDYSTIFTWFNTGKHNYGVIAGWRNLVIIDFDDMQEYRAWARWAAASVTARPVLTNAYQVSTARGVHLYIRLAHKERNRKIGKIDIKADGYVLGPGSIHPSGAEYRAMREVFNFPLVDALSDILPAAMLVQAQPIPSMWTSVRSAPQASGSLVRKVKQAFPIEGYFPDAKQSGTRYLMAHCPLHDDHNPSMWIDTKEQICGCFAGCTDKPLDVINLVGRMNGLNNRDALFYLAEKL